MIDYKLAQLVTKHKAYRHAKKEGLTDGEAIQKSEIAATHEPSVMDTLETINALHVVLE